MEDIISMETHMMSLKNILSFLGPTILSVNVEPNVGDLVRLRWLKLLNLLLKKSDSDTSSLETIHEQSAEEINRLAYLLSR